jgi:hypothetical protein
VARRRAMKEKLVTNIYLSAKLKELGLPQESQFYWVYDMDGWRVYHETELSVPKHFIKPEFIISAPTEGELSELFPPSTIDDRFTFTIIKRKNHWEVDYVGFQYGEMIDSLRGNEDEITDPLLVNAFAKKLIWLVENGYVEFK